MKEMPTDDPLFGKGTIRADGRKLHPMYLFEVKKPSESKGAVGLLQAARHDPGRPGVPAARPGRLPAREEVSALTGSGRAALARSVTAMIFGIPPQALFGQLLIGLINGSFYALLSLGLAVIFGLLNIINFTHGAQYMMGAFVRVLPAAAGRASATGGRSLLAPLVVGPASAS